MSQITPNRIIIGLFPVPPSVNRLYRAFNSQMSKTQVYRDYQESCDVWHFQHRAVLDRARDMMMMWNAIRVDAYVMLDHKRLLKKDGSAKRLDVSNRAKALHDELAKCLQIDDCNFKPVSLIPCVANHIGEQVVLLMTPHKGILTYDEAIEQINARSA